MYKKIVIIGDFNDADYCTSEDKITEEHIQKLLPVIEAIKNCKHRHNFPTTEYFNPRYDKSLSELYPDFYEKHEDGEIIFKTEGAGLLYDYVPRGEYGIHTIKSIKILTVLEEQQLL